jgi:spore germination protein YaaH
MKSIHHIGSLLFVLGIILIGLTMNDLLVQQNIVSPILPSSSSATSHKQPTPTPTSIISVWVTSKSPSPSYDDEIFSNTTVKTILPFRYSLNGNGTITSTEEATSSAFYVMPSVTDDNDPAGIHAFLASKEKQQRAIQLLIIDATRHHYAGYDINWPNIIVTDTDAFIIFLHELQQQLATSERVLSVTVNAPVGDSSTWGNTIGRTWPVLVNSVDYIRIMMYNNGAQRQNNEPLIDLFWYQNLIRFTSEILPKEKIIIGLPIVTVEKNSHLTEDQAERIALQWIRDEDSTEMTATFSAQGIVHRVWREDTQSIETKKQLAHRYHVYQFSFWYVDEDNTSIFK